MEVTCTLKITCGVSEIKGHGIEREIQIVTQALKDASLSGIANYVSGYRIDSVQESK